MRITFAFAGCFATLGLVLACGSSSSPNPATSQDASTGGDDDASSSTDGASPTNDAGGDAAPIPAAMPCSDSIADVYAATTASAADLGGILKCATDSTIDVATMGSRMTSAGITGVDATSGAKTYRVAFTTTRAGTQPGVSSARVYLPTTPRAGSPAIVVAHGTVGLAAACALSQYETYSDYLVLPWVAHGYAVIAPDYAGLGTPGVQGYGDNHDTGHSTLDASRALRKLVAAGSLTNLDFVVGHSQGGGSALSAQALAASYGSGGSLAGVVAFAPGWDIDVNVDSFRNTSLATSTGGGGGAAFGAMGLAAYFYNYVGPTHEGDGFGATARPTMLNDLQTQCITTLPTSIPQAAPTVGDFLDDTFRTTTIACADHADAGCAAPGQAYVSYLASNILTADMHGAPALVLQGMADTTVPPASTACVVKKLGADGVTPLVCTDASATHLDVSQRQAAFALSWVDAIISGSPAPTCTSALPACP